MRTQTVIILLSFFTLLSNGQVLKLGGNIGYSGYNQEDIKQLQYLAASELSYINVVQVERFPATYNFNGSLELFLNRRNLIGINYAFYSTGGRNHVKDYSAEYRMDIILNGNRLGIQYRHFIPTNKFTNIYFQPTFGLMFSKLKVDESFSLFEQQISNTQYDYLGAGYFIEPSFGYAFDFLKRFSIDINLGYQFDFKSEVHTKESKDDKLFIGYDKVANFKWNGIRVSIGLSINLFYSQEEKDNFNNSHSHFSQ